MKIVWDEPKRLRNIAIHGIDFANVVDFDWDKASIFATHRGVRGDRRLKAVGLYRGVTVTVVFALLGTEAISIISLRRSSKKEQSDHESRHAT